MIEAPDDTRDSKTALDQPTGRLQGWFQELRRRHIFKVTIAYLVLAWLLMQVAAVLESSLNLPKWTDTLTFVFLVIGFPVALFVTWAIDLTPERNSPVDVGHASSSNDRQTLRSGSNIIDFSTGKSSIAVLPFKNLSGDQEQDFIGDGLTADIISELSRMKSFFVIAHNSTNQYKEKASDVRQVAQELGVRYVVEGNIRRSGDRLRIAVQLIQADRGHSIWSGSYDRLFQDLFDIQQEITHAVVSQLEPELGRAEFERIKTKKPHELDAWELFHRGTYLANKLNLKDLLKARQYFEMAIEKEPGFAAAQAGLCWCIFQSAFVGDGLKRDYEEAVRIGLLAVQLDNTDAQCHYALSAAYMGNKQSDLALHEAELAVDLDPNLSAAQHLLAANLIHSGQAEKAIPHLEKAIALSPRDPAIARFYGRLSLAYLYLHQYETALEWWNKANKAQHTWQISSFRISALGHLGRAQEATEAISQFQNLKPEASVEYVARQIPTVHKPYMDHLLDGLRKAGLREVASEAA